MLCWCSILCWRFDWCIPQLAMIKLNDYEIDWKLVFKKDPRGRRLAQWRNVELTKGLMQKEMKLSEVNVIEKSELYCFKVRKQINLTLFCQHCVPGAWAWDLDDQLQLGNQVSCPLDDAKKIVDATKRATNCALAKSFFLVPAQTRKRRRSKSPNTCCPRWSFNTHFVDPLKTWW